MTSSVISWRAVAVVGTLCYSCTVQAQQPLLVMIHGRDQPVAQRTQVEATWRKALADGLRGARLDPIPPDRQRFVWYADLLVPGAKGCSYLSLDDAKADEAPGRTVWPELRSVLLGIAAQIPAGAQRTLLNHIMQDTETYLSTGSAACAVDQRLRRAVGEDPAAAALPTGVPVVVIAHSLGSMITYRNLMGKLEQVGRPVYLVTIGSMLGEKTVQRTLLGAHAAYPAPVPLPVLGWWNVVNSRDKIAFPAAPAFATDHAQKRPRDLVRDLGGPDAHNATRYLRSVTVSNAIAEAWCMASKKPAGCLEKKS